MKPGDRPKLKNNSEWQLILSCARLRLDSEQARKINALAQGPLDWDYLLETASRHAVLPLLYLNLNGAAPELVPAAPMERLRDGFQRNAARNLFLTGELVKILSLLTARGIAAVPFKGPALAAFVYGDLSLRQFGDLDILVNRAEVPEARELLVSLGYEPVQPLSVSQEQTFIAYFYHYEFEHPDTGVIVEIHWEVSRWHTSFRQELSDLWPRLEVRFLGGLRVLNFNREDLLLAVCAHSAKHGWDRLAWVADAATLIESKPGLDWAAVLARARRIGGTRLLFLGLFLARELLGTAVPAPVWHQVLSDPVVSTLARQVRTRLFSSDNQPHLLADYVLFLRTRERLIDKIRYCLQFAFYLSAEDLTFIALPRGLTFLYFILRPFRLACQYVLKPGSIP